MIDFLSAEFKSDTAVSRGIQGLTESLRAYLKRLHDTQPDVLSHIQARLQLFALAYNLGNFLRRLALPKPVRHWSPTTLREKLIKIGADPNVENGVPHRAGLRRSRESC